MDTHEIMFNLIKFYYNFGCYTNNNVAYFVGYNAITADDYKAITGDDYVASPVV
ncbi:phage uncharacterized protein, XkdX family [Lactobacillus bombicola]|uniref:Phage uncharacterized protein, XkdX family n=1 Tax=Lactobacillus bombicola TaxID=1505723 RepID=A0A1I1TQS1_9LACO|nr:XkdX family protein [Lactobacillus bombicola]SFD60889.1 phage uncharacterized protein, XkdX family [Lactobacillus bombicola]